MASGDHSCVKKFTPDNLESDIDPGITLPVYFKEEVIHIVVYSSQPIHQVKEAWQIKRPLVNFQNYEITLHFKDHSVEVVLDHEEVDRDRLMETECIRISQAGFHYNVPVHPDSMHAIQIKIKK